MHATCKNDGPTHLWHPVGRWCALALSAAVLIGVAPGAEARSVIVSIDDALTRILPWFEHQGWFGVVVYGICDAALVVLLLPVIVLAVGAGVIFGIVQGTLLMVVGTTLGATLAFLIGRHAFGPRLRIWLLHRRHARALAHALRDGGWLTVAALRMTPFFPFKSTNYVFGALDLDLRAFVLGTAAGILPLTAAAVTLGALAGDVTAALAARRSPQPFEWVLYGIGMICALAAVVTLTRRARHLLETHMRDETGA
ncbi:MAG: VTT domain-containing protein [Gammaproteobacteria bacterium]|nr:VTT domain-containing protein [Gammaproteobacteria bacterium]